MTWQMTCSRETLQRRAAMLQAIRKFFAERDVLEVDTPILSQAGSTDPNLDVFKTQLVPQDVTYYLQTSPEFAMKRLLAQDVGAIYQIAKVFRNGESSPKHNPEFTLLEWYRPKMDYHALMREVDDLLRLFLESQSTVKLSYQECFQEYCQLDPFSEELADFQHCADRHGLQVDQREFTEIDDYRHLLMTHVIEKQFPKQSIVFIYDYPASQAMLARLNRAGRAMRFEVYYQGLELGNGFQELTDPNEQLQRFQQDCLSREAQQKDCIPIDYRLIQALAHCPDCSGVAIGIERLLMLSCGLSSIAESVSFSISRA